VRLIAIAKARKMTVAKTEKGGLLEAALISKSLLRFTAPARSLPATL
jgi:hypothetical protein